MLTLLLLGAQAAVWYGPASVTFSQRFDGNPYDPQANDVRVVFQTPGGKPETRVAYWTGEGWKATLLSRRPGVYGATLVRNGKPVPGPSKRVDIGRASKSTFVRAGGAWGLRDETGKTYWPIGHNIGWGSNQESVPFMLKRLGKAGGDWARIWACHWDGKNPWWPYGDQPTVQIGELSEPVLKKWDEIVAAATASGVRFQLVLFHHGPWSSRVNSNWGENPWNAANGGFLAKPDDFFTNERAKRISKAWLRMAVARWGHEPYVLAWELFNEVEWCDPNYTGNEAVVGAWHDEMADYLRAIDPYKRLITTSSKMHLPIWRKMDVYQPHAYPASVAGAVLAEKLPGDKPLLFGEVGPGGQGADSHRKALREGIWAGLFAKHAGAAQYWYWDRIQPDNLLGEIVSASKIIHGSGILSDPSASPVSVQLDAPQGGALDFVPGGGWTATTRYRFRLPDDAAMNGTLSTYFQGVAHRDMLREPVVFEFNAPKAGEFTVRMTGAATSGGGLTVSVNGKEAFNKVWAPGERPGEVTVEFAAGPNRVSLFNNGPDWVQLGGIRIEGLARQATALAIGSRARAVVQVSRTATNALPLKLSLKNLPVADGSYAMSIHDLDSETRSGNIQKSAGLQRSAQVRSGTLVGGWTLESSTAALVLTRQSK